MTITDEYRATYCRRIQLHLPLEVESALTELAKSSGKTRTAVVCELILAAREEMVGPKKKTRKST